MPIVIQNACHIRVQKMSFTSKWLVGGVIWIAVVDRTFMRESCAILLAVSLESCSKANASADVIEEEITIFICFFSYDNV